METDPDRLMTPARTGESTFELEIPASWRQGRGAFGGLVAGALARAVAATTPSPLRALEVAMLGPVLPGRATLALRTLRQGSAVGGIALDVLQDGAVQTHGVAVTGAARANPPDWFEWPRPAIPDWRAVEPAPEDMPLAPEFTRFFEYRPTGPVPYQGGERARASGLIRARKPPPALDAAWAALLIDAWWTAALTRFEAPRPIATLAFTLHLVEDPAGLDPSEPLYLEVFAPLSRAGYLSEERRLWGTDGRLVAVNHQLIAVIR